MIGATGIRRIAAIAVAGFAFAAAGAGSATAGPPLVITQDVTGSGHFAKAGTGVSVSPGTFKFLYYIGPYNFTGDLVLSPGRMAFKTSAGFGVSADVTYTPTTQLSGTNVGSFSGSFDADIVLSNVKVAGLSVPVGDCETVTPIKFDLTAGPGFDLVKGGDLSSAYTVPEFGDGCGSAKAFVNEALPGPGNTLNLTTKQRD
jgi:hypothetical protein